MSSRGGTHTIIITNTNPPTNPPTCDTTGRPSASCTKTSARETTTSTSSPSRAHPSELTSTNGTGGCPSSSVRSAVRSAVRVNAGGG